MLRKTCQLVHSLKAAWKTLDNTKIVSDSKGGSTNDSTDENDLDKLWCELEKKVTPDGIQHRQLSILLKNPKTHQRNANRAQQDDCLTGHHRFLVDLVASESQINRREKREERLQAQRKQQEKEQAREGFTNPWLLGMETEMAECNRCLEGTEDAEM